LFLNGMIGWAGQKWKTQAIPILAPEISIPCDAGFGLCGNGLCRIFISSPKEAIRE